MTIKASDFELVVVIVGAMIVALAAAIVLEWRGFQASYRARGDVTISEYIYYGLGRSRKVVAIAGFIAGAAFCHFIAGA